MSGLNPSSNALISRTVAFVLIALCSGTACNYVWSPEIDLPPAPRECSHLGELERIQSAQGYAALDGALSELTSMYGSAGKEGDTCAQLEAVAARISLLTSAGSAASAEQLLNRLLPIMNGLRKTAR